MQDWGNARAGASFSQAQQMLEKIFSQSWQSGAASYSLLALQAHARSFAAALWMENTGEWLKRIWGYINHKFEIGNFNISLTSLIEGLVVLLAAIMISRWLRAFLARRIESRTHLDPGLQYTLLRLIHYAILAIGLLFSFHIGFNADLTTLAVVFTALSVGIGFGLQYIAGDIASGFILLFERPVRVGDYITITGPDSKLTEGRVQSINLRTTVMMTNDRIAVIVPNSKLVNQNLVNWSYADRRSRVSIPIGVASDSDIELVTKTLLRAADGVEYILPDPKPNVMFIGFGASTLDFRLNVWTDRPRRHAQIKSDINYRIWRLFKEAKIEIPSPQLDLNLRSGALPVVPADELLPIDDALGESDREETIARQ